MHRVRFCDGCGSGNGDPVLVERRAAHAGPIDDDTLVYRIELHVVSPDD